MFAVVANGIQTICHTQRQLDFILAVYPYPKFKKCKTEEDARKWLYYNKRSYNSLEHSHYGNTSKRGYVSIEYFITNDNIYYNVYTDKVGCIKIQSEENIFVDARRNLIKVKVSSVALDNMNITHHIVAIRRILNLLGGYVDIDIIVPDISVFLAITKYSGKNYMIRGIQKDIESRLGAVSITIRENQRSI